MTSFQRYLKEALYIAEQAGGGGEEYEEFPGDPPIRVYPDGSITVGIDTDGDGNIDTYVPEEDYNPDGDPEEEGEDDGDIDDQYNDEDFQRTLWWLKQGGPKGYLDYPGWDQGYYPGQDDKGLPISIPIPIDAPKP